MKWSELTSVFARIEGTSLRNTKTEILAELLRRASYSEVDKLVYLALGELRPKYDKLEFNLAEKMILRAIALAAGKTISEVSQEYKRIGDLGELAGMIGKRKEERGIREVYRELEKIAQESGKGSQERKIAGLAKLIKEVGGEGAKYVVRIVAGKLRLGFSDKTVLDAISYLEAGSKEYSEALDRVYQVRPDVGVLVKTVKEKGVKAAMGETSVVVGTPIMPALAQRLKTAKEMIEKMGRVMVEKKFDGTRVQIHFSRSENKGIRKQELGISQNRMFEEEKPKFWVRSFTRNLDESSAMFPELQQIGEQIAADEVILDSEAVGYEPATGKLVPFQLTITRKRKHGVGEAQNAVPLRFFVFDIMYLNGKSLIQLPLSERRKILARVIKRGQVLEVDDYIETDDPNQLREFHKQQLSLGLEGVLVKQIDGEYMPGRTGFNWVKFKEAEDSRAKLADTLDLVVMGYYLGKGKRRGFGLGAFLVGVREGEEIVTIAKVGTGISDKQFGELYERLKKIEVKRAIPEYKVAKNLIPDVWVEPEIVVEVAADEITKSPAHSAGYALRFPRLVRFREDKSVKEITTLDEVTAMIGI
ncbi:MAG: putative DNA ligase [Microgenomates group bacterium GW2011_GWC1_46_16]|uniref:Probable DNA ligase n=2 Tax=Candidatus Collieribacteriota TaxID=1752725 RepID=A0A1F5FYN5_9BACT|nr:MAG: putative DNA ligase [Microgenomates group bacterium GW2011_GWF1_46_12]KKU26762.1 MAG: putative DNA ligase [Microgenomates group bacterium GW2011_GWC1_46_16]KKU27996.1 MAG: putative DNA ligase [Microgenomates group bacterium GW2011_GWF2_46_18]KKU44231.1 MAG: putative DNA ligase [Microgenomates group bacterium GW2011_GWA1_46_7]KKU45670.1 MAG: putative DNA ligase [Microgenomates group bacterium GW2011_GWB1_46_7]KKU61749.1 MAG: putative DNA ligase [Microgenomates group bacterium GW2011_GWE